MLFAGADAPILNHMKKRNVRVSYGTAISLKLKSAAQNVAPTTAYLLWDSGCHGRCSFCPRQGENVAENRLSRVTWPEQNWDDVCRRLAAGEGEFRRICLQTGWNEAARTELLERVKELLALKRPLCVTLHPAQVDTAEQLIQMGVECVGIGVDAASARTYRVHKQREWESDLPMIEKLMESHAGSVSIHLIFGLGDTEREFAQTVDWVYARRGKVGMFALTPVRGARQALCAPDLGAWRRMQIFRYLRSCRLLTFSSCRFAEERLVGLPFTDAELRSLLRSGDAFRTAGCPDCNRPYYNERPGGILYNFPRPLTEQEAEQCISEAGPLKDSRDDRNG